MELKSVLGIKRIEYKEIEGAWVEFYKEPTMGMLKEIYISFGDQEIDKENLFNEIDKLYPALVCLIYDWNFSNDKGEKLSTDIETLSRLPYKIQLWLMECLMNIINEYETGSVDKKKE